MIGWKMTRTRVIFHPTTTRLSKGDEVNILIAGGGIGGITAAIALSQKGHDVTVMEQADRIREVGAGVQIWANGPRVLRRLGLGDLNEKLACPMDLQHVKTLTGDLLSTVEISRVDDHCGEPSYFAHRAELLDGLLNAATDVTIRCDAKVVSYTTHEDHVEVELANGETLSGDLLIGADGIHSTVRKQMTRKPKVRYSGFVAWRGIAEFDETSWETASEHWGVYLGTGSQRGVFPISNRRAYWFMTENRKLPQVGADERKDYLMGTLDGWHPIFKQTLEHATSVLGGPIFDLSPFKGWSADRVVLLGDACHALVPCLGQGACMAIEDAEVLSHVIGHSSSLSEDLERYEKLRFSRTRRASFMARVFGRTMQMEARWIIALRTKTLPLMAKQDPIKAMGWLLKDVTAQEACVSQAG